MIIESAVTCELSSLTTEEIAHPLHIQKSCKNCKKPGHADEECWHKDGLLGCRFCKKTNHVETECYWKDEDLHKKSGNEHQGRWKTKGRII